MQFWTYLKILKFDKKNFEEIIQKKNVIFVNISWKFQKTLDKSFEETQGQFQTSVEEITGKF